jgi:hypothetical protein
MTRAICTMLIGQTTSDMWHSWFETSWRDYCDRHGYELIVLDSLINESDKRHPAWQRLLVAKELGGQYEKIVWVDSDIWMSESAPDISDGVPDGKIGITTWDGSYNNDPIYYQAFEHSWQHNGMERFRAIKSFGDIMELDGFDPVNNWVNTGVMVLDPSLGDILHDLYYDNLDKDWISKEYPPMVDLMFNQGRDIVHSIDRRFNTLWDMECVLYYPFLFEKSFMRVVSSSCLKSTMNRSWFLHFLNGHTRSHARFISSIDHRKSLVPA